MAPKIVKSKSSSKSATADMYAMWTLHCVVDLTQALAVDFLWRPRRYALIDDGAAKLLTSFRTRSGHQPEWPSKLQRIGALYPCFGRSHFRSPASDGSPFHRLAWEVRRRASFIFERRGTNSDAVLSTAFLESARRLARYLRTFEGPSVRESYPPLANVFGRTRELFANESIAAVFGRPKPDGEWLFKHLDPKGDQLIQSISGGLRFRAVHPIRAERFGAAHSVALTGRELLAALDTPDVEEGAVDWSQLASLAYEWTAALRSLAASGTGRTRVAIGRPQRTVGQRR